MNDKDRDAHADPNPIHGKMIPHTEHRMIGRAYSPWILYVVVLIGPYLPIMELAEQLKIGPNSTLSMFFSLEVALWYWLLGTARFAFTISAFATTAYMPLRTIYGTLTTADTVIGVAFGVVLLVLAVREIQHARRSHMP